MLTPNARQRQRRREDALKRKALRAAIRVAVDELERGDYIEVDDAELDEFMEGLAAAPTRPTPASDARR